MRLGAIFPTTEIGTDVAQIRHYIESVEAMGYDHLNIFDHVLGADPNRPDKLAGPARPYTIDDQFHEPFAFFGWAAALTKRLELATEVLVLPQRQTALVAKQAAEVDVLSGGRFRLGVGIGWNHVEYEALGVEFRQRGARIEEQVEVLRLLWTQPRVEYHGRWHTISAAGINPLPVQRPIPIWFGGGAGVTLVGVPNPQTERVLDRIGRIGDGWFPNRPLDDRMRAAVEHVRTASERTGRRRDAVTIEGRVVTATGGPDDWAEAVRQWGALGATHVSITTMNMGHTSADGHLETLRRFIEAVRS